MSNIKSVLQLDRSKFNSYIKEQASENFKLVYNEFNEELSKYFTDEEDFYYISFSDFATILIYNEFARGIFYRFDRLNNFKYKYLLNTIYYNYKIHYNLPFLCNRSVFYSYPDFLMESDTTSELIVNNRLKTVNEINSEYFSKFYKRLGLVNDIETYLSDIKDAFLKNIIELDFNKSKKLIFRNATIDEIGGLFGYSRYKIDYMNPNDLYRVSDKLNYMKLTIGYTKVFCNSALILVQELEEETYYYYFMLTPLGVLVIDKYNPTVGTVLKIIRKYETNRI